MFTMEEVLSELSGGDINEQGLPPGFRFHPTDEELITFYLASKVFHGTFCGIDIAEVDLNRCEPWELPEAAKMGEREWYFFSLRDRKYPTGLRTNRATCAGYWKATGKDREVYSACNGALLGMKKTLVFYRGRAPKGIKTRWVMHEYRLDGDFSYRHSSREEWVICRIFHKLGDKKNSLLLQTQEEYGHGHENLESVSPGHSTPYSLPALFETPTPENPLMINHNQHQHLQSLLNIPISSSMPQSTLFHPSLPSPLGLPNPSTTPTSTASSISVHNINKTIKADVNHQQHSAPSATSSLFDSLVTNLHQQERHSCFTNWKLGGDDSQYQQQQLQQQLPVINSTIQKQCKIESDVNFPPNSVILQLPPHEPWLDKLLQTQHQSSQSSSHYPSSFKLDSNVTNTYGNVAAGFSFTAPRPTSPATAAALNTTTTTTAASVAAVHDLSTLISGFDCYGGLISNHAPLPIKLTGESWPLNP